MIREPFAAKPNSGDNWQEILNKPSPISVQRLKTGNLDVPLKGVLNLKHSNAKGIVNKRFSIPIFAYLVRHPEFGDYLIDGGLDCSYQKNPYGRLKGILVKMLIGKIVQKKGEDVVSQLEEMGIDLKGVFFTHLHFDHIAGVADLPNDLKYVAAASEKQLSIKLLFYQDHLNGIERFFDIDFKDRSDLKPFGPCVDIFGDGSLWALPTPGHTKGHISFLVNSQETPSLIAGDAACIKTSLEKQIGPGTYSSDLEMAQKSFEKIVSFVEQFPQVKVLLGHE